MKENKTEALLHAINERKITSQEAVFRLQNSIEKEYEKGKDADLNLISLCEDLLYKIKTGKEPSISNHTEKYLETIHQFNLCRQRRKKLFFQSTAFVCILAVFFFGGILLYRQWISVSPTDSGKQIVFTGKEISPFPFSEGQAEFYYMRDKTVYSIHELTEFLGFDPDIPETLGAYQFETSYACFLPDTVFITSLYSREDGNHINYKITYCLDIENFYDTYEKSEDIKTVWIKDTKVHTSKNINRFLAAWTAGNMVQCVWCDTSPEDCLTYAEILISRNQE